MNRLAVILVMAVALAACSSSSSKTGAPADPTRAPTTTSPIADLRGAVDDYVAAFGAGDGAAAWEQVSKRCRGALDETDYRATVAAAGVKYEGLRLVEYAESIDGTAATVTYSTSSSDLSYDDQRWVLERGAWRWDGC